MITDNFTLEFIKWLNERTTQLKENYYIFFTDGKMYTINELIEIFKTKYYEN